jgi:hypothetical protein
LVEPAKDNAEKIIRSLEAFGFKSLSLQEKDLIKKGRIIQLGYEPLRVDLLTSIDGCDFKEVWENRVKGIYGKEKVIFIGIKELIKNKKSSGRKQDNVDISLLMSRKKKT